MNSDHAFLNRTEEVQEIIDRIPTKIGYKVTGLIGIFIMILFIFGWIIKYPDIVIGQVSINAENVPVKLVSNISGRLWINGLKSLDDVRQDDYIAVIQSSANLQDMQKVGKLIKEFNPNTLRANLFRTTFPENVSLGELNDKYFSFIGSYKQFINFHSENLLMKQENILHKMLNEQHKILDISEVRLDFSNENLHLTRKFFEKDSILHYEKVLSESDLDRSQISLLNSKDNYQNQVNNIVSAQEQIHQTINNIQQNKIQQRDEARRVQQDLVTSYAILLDNFKAWEDRYVFKAPFSGKVQFLGFLNNDQFIQQGEAIFTIIPDNKLTIGQMILPAQGAGKVNVGQEVIIKLENYPYLEYGTIQGFVSSISLTTSAIKTDKGILETYLLNLRLPDSLKTSYGETLDFQFELKGSGEIITRKRRLIQRLFENLKNLFGK